MAASAAEALSVSEVFTGARRDLTGVPRAQEEEYMAVRLVEVENVFYGVSTYLDLCQPGRNGTQVTAVKCFKKYNRKRGTGM